MTSIRNRSFRKSWLISIIFVLVAAVGVVNPRAHAGPEVPFPLSAQIPFPWGLIQGLWEAKDEASDDVYSFEVMQSPGDELRALRILRLDRWSRTVLACGAGLSDSQMLVRGVMRGLAPSALTEFTKQSTAQANEYIIIVRAFSIGEQTQMVLTERSLQFPKVDEKHFVLRSLPGRPFGLEKNEVARRREACGN